MFTLTNVSFPLIRCLSIQNNVIRQISRCLSPTNSHILQSSEHRQRNQCTCYVYSTKASLQPVDGMWTRLKKSFGFRGKLKYSKTHLNITATKLYLWYTKQVDPIEIMRDLGLPDTFNSWFLVTELHMWLLMNKLVTLGEEGRLVRNHLVSSLWKDVDERSKSLKAFGLSSKRNEALEHFHGHLILAIMEYDEGILSHDRVLAGAIWRMLFEKKEVDPEKLEKVVEYVRKQVKHLEEQDSEVLLKTGVVQLLPFFSDRKPMDLTHIINQSTLKKLVQ